MKRILFVLDELFPVRGAPQVRIQNLYAGVSSFVRAAVGGRLAEGEEPQGFTLIKRPSERSPLAFILFLFRLGRLSLRKARAFKPDFILLSVPKYEMLFFAPALRKLAPTLILDFRDSLAFLDYGAYLSHFLPGSIANKIGGLLSRANRVLQERAIRSATLVTVANEGIRRSIAHPNVTVIPNGVDTETFKPVGKSWYDGRRPLRLAYLGNFAEKDLFTWLSGLRGIEGIEIHLIGEGRNKVKIASELSGLQFVFHGSMGHDQLPRLLEQMDLGFIFRKPGVDQSIPVCFFEFTAMNIPSVCNETGLMAEFVHENGVGYVVRGERELVSLIEGLRRDPNQLKQFKELHALAERKFSLRASREKFASLLESFEETERAQNE